MLDICAHLIEVIQKCKKTREDKLTMFMIYYKWPEWKIIFCAATLLLAQKKQSKERNSMTIRLTSVCNFGVQMTKNENFTFDNFTKLCTEPLNPHQISIFMPKQKKSMSKLICISQKGYRQVFYQFLTQRRFGVQCNA